jgi:hypothetical protein
MNETLKAHFYPTPKALISRMLAKVKGSPDRILEPSAGKGDIIEYLKDNIRCSDISAIEINEDLQATLRGKDIKVIDADFLHYSGADQFDLIIANPPFEEGDKHLLKALDIMYCGEIVFLLNAETIKNPYSNTRKDLVKRLTDLGADIQYIQEAFKSAERPTGVEAALVYVNIERKVEEDIFKDCQDKVEKDNPEIEKNYELSNKKAIEELVAEYNQVVEIGKETIIGYFKNFKKVGEYIKLNDLKQSLFDEDKKTDMTALMRGQLNEMLGAMRKDFWRRTLVLPEVKKRMTGKKQAEFEHKVDKCCDMDFTEDNIRQFILNLINTYHKTLSEGVVDIFDMFTIRYHWSEDNLYNDNIHYYNGWKTNKAFKICKRVIIPMHGLFDWGHWRLDYNARRKLDDIDIVMSYFNGGNSYLSIANAIDAAYKIEQSRNILSTFFKIATYKKGSIHLEFLDENILRRFNVAASVGKNWLPGGYGRKHYEEYTPEEQKVVDTFEGAESYTRHLNQPLFDIKAPLQLEAGTR